MLGFLLTSGCNSDYGGGSYGGGSGDVVQYELGCGFDQLKCPGGQHPAGDWFGNKPAGRAKDGTPGGICQWPCAVMTGERDSNVEYFTRYPKADPENYSLTFEMDEDGCWYLSEIFRRNPHC